VLRTGIEQGTLNEDVGIVAHRGLRPALPSVDFQRRADDSSTKTPRKTWG